MLLLQISDTGLGALDKNAETIFSNLNNVTQNSVRINTFANVKASVDVLSTMSVKLKDKLKVVDNVTTTKVSKLYFYYYLNSLTNIKMNKYKYLYVKLESLRVTRKQISNLFIHFFEYINSFTIYN